MTSSKAVVAAVLFALAGSAAADTALHGHVKVCRDPRMSGTTDHKAVTLPANASYTGACDRSGGHCRNIVITVTSSAVLGADQACITLPATLTQSDGKPVKAGESLVSQWSITGFNPAITVTDTFH